ncbi:MAG: hypothetical protein ACLQFM_14800 [Terriglobales bacterium]
MSCRSCTSRNQTRFVAEISVHILGIENIERPAVLVFPKLLTCMDCGFTEFTMAENDLQLLRKHSGGAAADTAG